MMTLSLTQVGYSLALVQSNRQNGDFDLFVKPLLNLTGLIFWLWSIVETLHRFYVLAYDWHIAIGSLVRSVDMVLDVYAIQFEILLSSFRYGLSYHTS
jgi:hypothetical protein